jgi:hypothetical protein
VDGVVTTGAETEPVLASRKVFAASTTDEVVEFKVPPTTLSRPMAHCAIPVQEHVFILIQPFLLRFTHET